MSYIDQIRRLSSETLRTALENGHVTESRRADINAVLQEREMNSGGQPEAVLAAEALADAYNEHATVPQMQSMIELTKKSFERVGPTLSGPAFLARLERHLTARVPSQASDLSRFAAWLNGNDQ